MSPRISVVVPAYNAAATLADCLAALLAQPVSSEEYEVLVVDDGSTDATAEIAGRFPVTLLQQPHQGAAAARNLGIARASGDLVFFTDADCAPSPTWLAEMRRPFADAQVAGVKGVYATRQRGLLPRFVQAEYEEKYARLASFASIDFVDTYSAGYRRQVLAASGGFDVAFPDAIVEDQELSFRLAERGHKLVLAPQAVVYHEHVASLAAYWRRKFAIGYWKVLVHRKHPGKLWADTHTPQMLKAQIMLGALAGLAVVGWPFAPALGPIFWAAVALFLASTLPFLSRILRREPAMALVSPFLLLLRAAALGLGFALGTLAWLANSEKTKRGLDLVVATVCLILSAPLILFLAILIRLESPGPALLAQTRIGKDKRPFQMYKLRSMVQGADEMWERLAAERGLSLAALKVPNDPRVTRLGRFLRRFSLDELPQFLNVLKGEMSLVGPRPEEPRIAAVYTDWHFAKFRLRPGMSGPMQVNGRADLCLDERTRLELAYVQNRSLWQDLCILAQTIPAILGGKGSY